MTIARVQARLDLESKHHPVHLKRDIGVTGIGKNSLASAKKKAQKMGLDRVQRTIWMCVDRGTAKCASKDVMSRSWEHLRKRLKAAGKADSLRTFAGKTHCVGICRGGPILCIMPENVWYGQCLPDVIDEIVDQHLIGGNVVTQYVISRPSEAAE